MGSSAPPTKRTRNNAGIASERKSDVNSPQLLELIKTRFEEQTEKIESTVREAEQRMLRSLMDRLDKIAGEVKQMDARVLTLEREVADLRSMRDRMGERVETLNREVENLQAAGQRLGGLEARLATQCREFPMSKVKISERSITSYALISS